MCNVPSIPWVSFGRLESHKGAAYTARGAASSEVDNDLMAAICPLCDRELLETLPHARVWCQHCRRWFEVGGSVPEVGVGSRLWHGKGEAKEVPLTG
jgi:ribosomal protein L37AE/L43A